MAGANLTSPRRCPQLWTDGTPGIGCGKGALYWGEGGQDLVGRVAVKEGRDFLLRDNHLHSIYCISHASLALGSDSPAYTPHRK